MDPVKQSGLFDPKKKAFSLFEEFKNFAFKGNVIDLAVGVIIGMAFGNGRDPSARLPQQIRRATSAR